MANFDDILYESLNTTDRILYWISIKLKNVINDDEVINVDLSEDQLTFQTKDNIISVKITGHNNID